MRKLALLLIGCMATLSLNAQKNGFINTETVFKSIAAYNQAIENIDSYASEQQSKIDDEYAKIAEMFERYQYQKQNLSEAARKQVEDNIIQMEQQLTDQQRNIFGPEGEVMKMRIQLLKPIQDNVFSVIDDIAQQNGYDIVIDISNNPSVVYYKKSQEITDEVIRKLGINN